MSLHSFFATSADCYNHKHIHKLPSASLCAVSKRTIVQQSGIKQKYKLRKKKKTRSANSLDVRVVPAKCFVITFSHSATDIVDQLNTRVSMQLADKFKDIFKSFAKLENKT